MDYKNYTIL